MNNIKQPSRDFVAIDVEYADREQNICQIGLAIVKNLQIVDTRSWLIQPPCNYYDENYMGRHHVTPDMTENAPTFDVVWQEIQPIILQQELWAHNAVSVEQPVLRRNIRNSGYDASWLDIRDSRDLYQRPDCPANSGNGLIQCCMALSVPRGKHHDAQDDAEMCAEIVIACAEGRQPDWTAVPKNSEELRKAQQTKRILRLGDFTGYFAGKSSGEEDVHAVLTSTYAGAQEQEVDVWDRGDRMPTDNKTRVDFTRINTSPDNPINGKVVVLTGVSRYNRTSLKEALDAMGAKHPSTISGKTYAVIFGTRNVSRDKLQEIEEQESKGHHIFRIVGDDDLEKFLYGDSRKFFTE